MKTLKSVVIIAFLFVTVLSSAQEKVISLKDINDISIPNFGFYVSRLTNVTGDARYVGSIESSVFHVPREAYFESDIVEEVGSFLQRNMTEDTKGKALVVRIERMGIWESYDLNNESAGVVVDITFFYKEDGYYIEKFSAHGEQKIVQMAGVTKQQPRLIAKAIAQCFRLFDEAHREGCLHSDTVAESVLNEKPIYDREEMQRLLSVNRNHVALYRNFVNFRDHAPDTTRRFLVDADMKLRDGDTIRLKEATATDATTGHEITNVWGFSDGIRTYVKFDNTYLPLDKDEFGYYIDKPSHMDWSLMSMGQFSGSGIGLGATFVPGSKLRLNIFTGDFYYSEVPQEHLLRINQGPTRVIFYGSFFNGKGSSLQLFIDGEHLCDLTRNTWYEFKYSDVRVLEVELRAPNGEVSNLILNPIHHATTIILCIDKKKKPPVMDEVSGEKREEIEARLMQENKIAPLRMDCW